MVGIKTRGFTLIELLIVVAIIAILAAIAVPNFLEAQTRSKVARVKSDMRTLAVAEEAYRVDWNTYTHSNGGQYNPWDPTGPGHWSGFGQLTTPVSYITSIPLQPFGDVRLWGALGSKRWPSFRLGTGSTSNRLNTGNLGGNMEPNAFPADCFNLYSDGPDLIKDSRGDFIDSGTGGGYPWINANPNDVAGLLAIVYDPTNGTVSRGDVMRVGGAKPRGALFDALFAAASK